MPHSASLFYGCENEIRFLAFNELGREKEEMFLF